MIYGRNTIITPDIVKLDEHKEEFLKPADLEKLIVDELRRGTARRWKSIWMLSFNMPPP